MDHFLYTAMSGAKQIFYAQQSNANNLANAQTTGFKQDLADARAMPVFGPGMPTRVYSMTERPTQNFNPGGFITTGRDLDAAVQTENGFFSVLDKRGNEAYTRMGEFKINEAGMLTTMTGLPVLGDGGPIVIPPADKVDIGSDGTITIHPVGEPQTVTAVIGQLKLVRPEFSDIKKNEDGLFVRKDGEIMEPNNTVQILGGGIEGSNVNAVEAMTNMINLQRQYEMQAKMLKTAKDMEQASSQLLRA